MGPAARVDHRQPRPVGAPSVQADVGPATVCFPFVGDHVGGAHVSALKLIDHLDRRRYLPLVVLHAPDGPLADLLDRHGIAHEPAPTVAVPDGRRPLAGLACLYRGRAALGRFLAARGVRIVHTNDGRMHAAWALPARRAGARLVWHHRANPRAKGARYLAPWLADQVVAVSAFAAPRPPWFARRDCAVVPSPFDTDKPPADRAAARQMLLAELDLPADVGVVGYFGNLVPRKRPHVFIEAIAALRARAPGLAVVGLLFGSDIRGHGGAIAQHIIAQGVGDRVRLMGFRYPPEPWLAACDVLLVPAVEEPFGRTLIEAMLLGTVVIAADSGGNPEALRDGETGFLVPPDQPERFAARVRAVLDDPDLRTAVCERARADAVARFGTRRHAEAIMRIYDRLLQR